MNKEEELEIYLDTLYSKLYKGKTCFNCNRKASQSHHNLRFKRENYLYRFDYRNALPCCLFCHQLIHSYKLKEPELDLEDIEIKDYLIRDCLSDIDFLNIKKGELEWFLDIKDSKKIKVYKKKKLSETKAYKESQERQKEWNKKLYQLKKQYKNEKEKY